MKTNHTLSSVLYLPGTCYFFGDTRGNLSYFTDSVVVASSSSSSSKLRLPESRLMHLHSTSPVSRIVRDPRSGVVRTIGHDGYLTALEVAEGGSMRRLRRTRATFASALTDLHILENSDVVIGGFRASIYILFNVTQSYQLLQIDAGGWKRPREFSFHFHFGEQFGVSMKLALVNNRSSGQQKKCERGRARRSVSQSAFKISLRFIQ